MVIRAGPARFSAPNHPPSFAAKRLSINAWTDALVLAAALGIRGAGCAAGAAGCGAAGGCCAPAADAVATAITLSKRKTLILEFLRTDARKLKGQLKVSFLHLGEELFRLFLGLDRRFIGGIVRQILVVLFSESLWHLGIAATLGGIFFGKRHQLAVIHDWFG